MQEICTITDFGADSSGKAPSTEAIRQAIRSGAGGTVVFPAGEFVSSSLELRDDTAYRFEKGCVLRAEKLSSFAPIGYRHNEMKDVTSLLWAIGKKNITICGDIMPVIYTIPSCIFMNSGIADDYGIKAE